MRFPMRALRPVALIGVVAAASCVRRPAEAPLPRPLPEIPVYEIAPRPDSIGVVVAANRARDPLSEISSTKLVTLTTSNADVRTLLMSLAQEAGVDLVVSPDVRARVSVSFTNLPVAEAMRAVIAEAGLSLLVGRPRSPWPPVVFYQLPVNIEYAPAHAIASRFGVSLELAKWIVESRVTKP